MITEKDFENIICKYPELIEENLVLKGQQIRVYGKIMDIMFEDKFGQKLIVELKVGPIDRKDIGQVMEYEGGVLSVEEPTARIILIGNRVPPNLKKALDHHGIEWREISLSQLKEFLKNKSDTEFLKLFAETQEQVIKQEKIREIMPRIRKETSGVWIFQSNPRWYRLLDKLKVGSDRDTWRVMRFKKEIQQGDTVLFWISGGKAGIYAIGVVDSELALMHADEETKKFATPEYERTFPIVSHVCPRVWVKYTKKFVDKPILKEDLKNNDILRNLSVIKQPQGTNFRVTKEQFEALKKLISF